MGYEFEYSTCLSKSSIDEESDGKPSHKVRFSAKLRAASSSQSIIL